MVMIKRIFLRICKMMHVNRILCKIFARHCYLHEFCVQQARGILERVSPKPQNSSCIRRNHICKTVDLHIIVPVYNQEQYLEACIESIIGQMKKYSYCVTMINDGSTDGTKAILEKYIENENIEIIHQENRGFSGARNRGLQNIKGKYVTFIDSDDVAGNLEAMLDHAFENNADIVRGAYASISEEGKLLKMYPLSRGILSPREAAKGTPWGKIYKAECLKDVQFPENYWFEDTICEAFWPRWFQNAVGISEIVYYYRRNRKGISFSSAGKSKSIDTYWILEQIFDDRKKIGIPVVQDDYEFVLRMVKLSYSRTKWLDEEIKKALFVSLANFVKETFPNFHTKISDYIMLEKAINEMDYGYYVSFCDFM